MKIELKFAGRKVLRIWVHPFEKPALDLRPGSQATCFHLLAHG